MWPFGKRKPRNLEDMYQVALRHIDTESIHHRPSWLSNSNKEREFFDKIIALINKGSTSPTMSIYAAHGFMSPQSSTILFSFAASMESQGATFDEQQVATVRFIKQMWDEMLPHDQEDFLRAIAR